MKTVSVYSLIVLLLAGVVSCSKAPGSATTPDAYSSNYFPYLNGATGGNVAVGTTLPDFTTGATSTLTIDGASLAERNQLMGQYTMRGMNDPQNIQVNVTLSKTYGGIGYGGAVVIRYQDNGVTRQSAFKASQADPKDTNYNIWFNYGGKTVFHGFFEDNYGAIIIVFDGLYNLGDGSPAYNTSGGSIYFKNLVGSTYAGHPPAHCWRVSIGPYDCRAWKSGDGVNTTLGIYPETYNYTRLGTFAPMNLSAAFGGT